MLDKAQKYVQDQDQDQRSLLSIVQNLSSSMGTLFPGYKRQYILVTTAMDGHQSQECKVH